MTPENKSSPQPQSNSDLSDELALACQKIAELEEARSELKVVALALRESEERFRIALQNSNIVVYSQDTNLRYTWIYNPLLGFTPEGILGKTDAELLLPEDAAVLDTLKRSVLDTGLGTRETVRNIIEGEDYFYDLTIEPLCDEQGNIVGVTGASRDITEHLSVEEALRMARDELELRVEERTADLGRGQQRERALNALLRLSMEDISLDEQLERALDVLVSIPWLPVQREGGIFLTGDDGPQETGKLELRAHRGFGELQKRACARISFGQCLCGRAAADKELLFTDHRDQRHEIHYDDMDPHGHYCVPILHGDRSIGTIILHLDEAYSPDVQHEEFLRAAADTLAGVIERKRAEEALRQSEARLEDHGRELEHKVAERTREIERRHKVAESLRGILNVLNSDRALDEILSFIVTEARRLLGSGTCALYRLADPDGTLEIQTVQGRHAESVAALQFLAEVRQALLEGQPVAVSDQTDAGRNLIPVDLSGSCQAMLVVPLIIADELYGGLVLYYSESRQVSAEDVDLAVAFADQAALAIENARLHLQAEEAAVLEERGRLARELHDSVTQSLYSITLLAEGWKRLSQTGRLKSTEDPLTELGEIAQQALKEMRLMVHELRPPDLEEVGLLGALRRRLDTVEKRAGVEARLVADGEPDLPDSVEDGLYWIALEALNNALKHAAATQVTVTIHRVGGRTTLEVEDNGRGSDPANAGSTGGVGLNSMHERAARMGGTLRFDSAPGRGTTIGVDVETRRES